LVRVTLRMREPKTQASEPSRRPNARLKRSGKRAIRWKNAMMNRYFMRGQTLAIRGAFLDNSQHFIAFV